MNRIVWAFEDPSYHYIFVYGSKIKTPSFVIIWSFGSGHFKWKLIHFCSTSFHIPIDSISSFCQLHRDVRRPFISEFNFYIVYTIHGKVWWQKSNRIIRKVSSHSGAHVSVLIFHWHRFISIVNKTFNVDTSVGLMDATESVSVAVNASTWCELNLKLKIAGGRFLIWWTMGSVKQCEGR